METPPLIEAAILLLVAQFAGAGVLQRQYVCVCTLYVGVAELVGLAMYKYKLCVQAS